MLLLLLAMCAFAVCAVVAAFLLLRANQTRRPSPSPPEEPPSGPEPEPEPEPVKPGKPEKPGPGFDDPPPEDPPSGPAPEPASLGSCKDGALFCTDGATNKGGTYSVGAKARYQKDVPNGPSGQDFDGFCGEQSIQIPMLKYGVWISQENVRLVGTGKPGGDILPENGTYEKIFKTLKVKAEKFTGNGYQNYIAWLKPRLVRGLQCIIVYDFSGGDSGSYGHIVNVTGIKTTTPTGGYNADDTLIVHTHFTDKPVERKVGSYSCKGGKQAGLEGAGCVPSMDLASLAWCVLGPLWLGIGPPVELVMADNVEPCGVEALCKNPSSQKPMKATVVVHNLVANKKYAIYQITKYADLPGSPSAKLSGTPWKTFTATGSRMAFAAEIPYHLFRAYICVAA